MKQPELGKRISSLRKEKGLTQEELVEQCNINVRTIQRIEAGEVNPRSYTIKAILEVLGEEFKQNETILVEKKANNNWTKPELKTLHNSWFYGIFYAVITLVTIVLEIRFELNHTSPMVKLIFRVPFLILFFILIIPFLKGYKLLSIKFNKPLLNSAVYIYFTIAAILAIITLFSGNNSLLSAIEIVLGVFVLIIFGIGEIILGIGILKLKENLDTLAQVTGIVKIVNGAFLVTVILSPIGLFLVIPVLILEIIFLHNTYQDIKNLQEVKV
ncbi:helix-turn-helix transcriptional regulator [uncultured Polaribacter sp.]|uniref:helix-turn-helix domain-containing protein n=1 Tax=uncultured Polaribacter sp. TaxID=174711 RepID=UPI00261512E1|nr:helix-turn-helix transcriptional regulator [uncultured Polaribacter sp.]